jgi:hypothetical protein
VQEQQQVAEKLRLKLQEREERIGDLEQRESEIQVKEIESLRMQRMMADMRERCEKRERELDAHELDIGEQRQRLVEREKMLEQREDAATALERQVRRYELESQERWETVFRKGQMDLDVAQERLQVREMEVVNREAELAVKEQIFDANQRKAESTSLPERERRLKMLLNIEQQLAQRERNLRQPERDMVRSMMHPEMVALREENLHLQAQVARQRIEMDGMQQRIKEESEKYRAERQTWIEKSKSRMEAVAAPNAPQALLYVSGAQQQQQQAASGAATSPGTTAFASARSRRQSILGSSSVGSPMAAMTTAPAA